MYRVPVISPNGKPLMPAKPSRVRRWLKAGKARVYRNDLNTFAIQLLEEPSGEEVQPISVGIDPGKHFSGVGVQSSKFTLWTAHLILPFETVKKRMEQRRLMRRNRRGRRINRKLPYHQRAHRQKRFNNRRGNKLPPSIRANRQLELRVVKELMELYPISQIVYEIVKADVDKTKRKSAKSGRGFSPVMAGQNYQLKWLSELAPTVTRFGWQTANLRNVLRLEKQKHSKGDLIPATHAVDGVALAAHAFTEYQTGYHYGHWVGKVTITNAPFTVSWRSRSWGEPRGFQGADTGSAHSPSPRPRCTAIRRPPISRRQLHLMVQALGGVRRKYGGTTTRHHVRKGDFVKAVKAGETYYGWVSGDTAKQISVSSFCWKRLGQFTASKVVLLARATGLICKQETGFRASSY